MLETKNGILLRQVFLCALDKLLSGLLKYNVLKGLDRVIRPAGQEVFQVICARLILGRLSF